MAAKIIGALLAGFVLLQPVPGSAADAQVESPAQLYGKLFQDVQTQRVFADGKTFVDAVAKAPPSMIMRRYESDSQNPAFNLAAFVERHFTMPRARANTYRADPGQDVCSHIDTLWPVLERKPDRRAPRSSLLPLPYRYVVPGDRFNEIYYWDTYFTMLGLEESGRHDLAFDMVKNIASMIETYGHMPNGNRSYYLSRSQPPFLVAMIDLIADKTGDRRSTYAAFLPALLREYAFWMDGADGVAPGSAYRRVVRLPDGAILNRYWDDRDDPRDESYREDVETARASGRPQAEVYRDLRAGGESGWDFSSRWFADGKTLASIRTTALLPVDLNSMLYRVEMVLAQGSAMAGQSADAAEFRNRALERKQALQRYFWDPEQGIYTDYVWAEEKRSAAVTGAMFFPLFVGLADQDQAAKVAAAARAHLLRPGGLMATTVTTGQQWDAPNGWAPLQWVAIKGLNDYRQTALAETIAGRWMSKIVAVYRATGKLMEKYNVVDEQIVTGGGEYPTQDGFGWTNGVMRKLLALYPNLVAPPEGQVWCGGVAANDNTDVAPPRRPALGQ